VLVLEQLFAISLPDEVLLAVPVVPGEEVGQPRLEHPVETTNRTTGTTSAPLTSILQPPMAVLSRYSTALALLLNAAEVLALHR